MSTRVGPALGEQRLAPSTVGSVVLDVGGDVGALVVAAAAAQCGQEIELVPLATGRPLTHTEVRERRLAEGPVYAAVFPGVASGAYHLRTRDGVVAPIEVAGGAVTSAPWPRP